MQCSAVSARHSKPLCHGLPQSCTCHALLPCSSALQVFFSFLGFDCVASAAEETIDPAASLPVGIIASLLICAVIYAAMCATIVGMVPWQDIDVDTPFSTAYAAVGMPWAGRLVSLGALLGTVTCLLVSIFGQVRLCMALGRSRLLPPSCVRPQL